MGTKYNQMIGVNAELSALEEGISNNIELRKKLEESTAFVEDQALKIIQAMGVAFDTKNESIEKLRAYRVNVAKEVGDITQAMTRLREVTNDKTMQHTMQQMKEFLDVCERISSLETSGFFKKFNIDA